jgi:hypothetical protein
VRSSSPRLDELLPHYEFAERHATRVDASPAAALTAAKQATPGEMPLVRTLFALRSGPALLARGRGLPRAKDVPLAQQMIEFGFVPLADHDDELVLGFVGQPWKAAGGSMPRPSSAEAWSAFDEPGFAKAVMNFRSAAVGDQAVLETETRVYLTDAPSRRRFARYWRLIRPWSGLIRRSWLRAAKRRAEAVVP